MIKSRESETEWRINLKAGDEVFISQSYGQAPQKATVLRTTATMVLVATPSNPKYEQRFYKETGWSVGASQYHRNYLIQPSDEVRERIEIEKLQAIAVHLRNRLAIPKDKETLKAFIAAMREFVKEEVIVPK